MLLDAAYDAETGTFSKAENTVVTQTEYDGQNRAVKSVDGKGIVTENTYDTEGRMTSVIQDASGSRITTTVSYTEPVSGENTSSAVITMAGGSKSRTVTDVQGQTVLESTIGGAHGGGAVLTPQARALLTAYRDYTAQVEAFAREQFAASLFAHWDPEQDL